MLRFLQERKVLLVYTPLILYWIVLLFATSVPDNAIPTTGVSDKILHFMAYFVLGVLLNLTLAFQNKYKLLQNKSVIATLILGSMYGIFDEVHQYFIPGRSMELFDLMADFSGLVLATVFVILLMKYNNFVPEQEI